MWQQLDKPLAIFLIVALPLVWGLAAEYVFELLRRKRGSGREASENAE